MDAFFLLVLLLCTPKLSQATTVTWQLPNLPLGVPVLENRASKQWHIDREGDLGMKRAGRNRAAKPRLSNAPRPRFSTLPPLDSAEERVTKFGHTRS
uniref:Uncharacterized protein n=1 Tax=Oryza barthii TaxID=65489 RepID=A0A0D3EVT1_9ORYZ